MNILIVDDEESIRITFAATLRAAGYQVATAENVAQAREALARGGVDLVLTDVVMPGARGTELLAALQRGPSVLVIIMTGQPDVETAVEAVRGGAFDFIVKPVERQALLMAVRRAENVVALERERARLAADLEQHAVELEARNAELERVQRARAAQVSFLVHDLRNPLTAIGANLDVLAEEPLPPDARVSVDDARAAALRLREMLNDILDVGRSSDGKLEVHRARVASRPLIEEVVARHAALARGRRSTLTAAVDEGAEAIDADPNLLRRALGNLVENALRHAGVGARVELRVARAADGGALVTVADDGPGIAPELRERIFEPWERGDAAGGQGLGLTFCRVVAQAHGGTIRAVANQPAGAKFELALPRAAK